MLAPNLLAQQDPEVWNAIRLENQRQEDHVELIASENYASRAVLAAQGSALTNKYAEGYPGKRYYGGCAFVDVAEHLAIERAKQLFGCDYANVQPHSGSQANQAVYLAFLKPGDSILGMSLAHGGHLSHGAAVNASGKLYHAVSYGLDANEVLDYAEAEHERALNSAIFPGIQGGPLMHVIAAKAVALGEALKPEFREYQAQVLKNARAMAQTLQARGLRIVSGRTECHLFLVDLRAKRITGRDAEEVLGRAHITVNKNAIPNDPEKPMVTSGIRIGSPAITTRGFKEKEAVELARLIADVLEQPASEAAVNRDGDEIRALCARFPVYA